MSALTLDRIRARFALTPQENLEHAKARRTHCGRGHRWSELTIRINGLGFRECRACHREREAERKAANTVRVRAYRRSRLADPSRVRSDQHGTRTGYSLGCVSATTLMRLIDATTRT